jgi:hypothetical protein
MRFPCDASKPQSFQRTGLGFADEHACVQYHVPQQKVVCVALFSLRRISIATHALRPKPIKKSIRQLENCEACEKKVDMKRQDRSAFLLSNHLSFPLQTTCSFFTACMRPSQ